jgi:hypothetical protein
LNFSTTDKNRKLKFLGNMPNLMIVDPQKKNMKRLILEFFKAFFLEHLIVTDGKLLMGHCDFIERGTI